MIDDGTAQTSRPYNKPLKILDVSGEWKITKNTNNYLLKDKCDVYINDTLLYRDYYAEDVSELLYRLENVQSAECLYYVCIDTLDTDIYLSFKNSDTIDLKINGIPVEKTFITPNYNDLFPSVNITEYMKKGENVISLYSKITLSQKHTALHEKASVNRSELNKMTYKTEFSSIYIMGDFSVHCDGIFELSQKSTLKYKGDFSIGSKKQLVPLSHLEQWGFPFFEGEITLSKTFNLSDTSYCLKIDPQMIRSVAVEVNGKSVSSMIYYPYECDISDFLVKGDNEISLTFTSGFQNLLSPHHKPPYELDAFNTEDFYKEPSLWNNNTVLSWDDDYYISEFGVNNIYEDRI